jgi:signal peptidase I
VGDLILVNKYTYGIRLPILNKKIIEVNDPQRGDVMVFKYPKDMNQDYIKRVIGIPGDKITYENKRLTINGQPVAYTQLDDFFVEGKDGHLSRYRKQLVENLPEKKHLILNFEEMPSGLRPENFPYRENCDFSAEKFSCTVPAKHYFMMGDNRDNSQDSRYWGFVPDQNIVGKAFFVWMNLGNPQRIGGIE